MPFPAVCPLDVFLGGAQAPVTWLHQEFKDYLEVLDLSFNPSAVELVGMHPHYGLTLSRDGTSALLVFAPHEGTWKNASVVGYYNPPGAVCLDGAHQGQGLGAELILWTALHLTEGPPTASLDEQAFTPAGHAAHCAAWRLGVQRGLFQAAQAPTPSIPRRHRLP